MRMGAPSQSRSRRIAVTIGLITAFTAAARLRGYELGLNTIVRCRDGHLFTTIWIPGVKLKALDLGVARVQRCPVGGHWTLVTPVRTSTLSDKDRKRARSVHDVSLP
jgi:hypothetical protein